MSLIIRLATLGALIGFILVAMNLPSWRPENRLPYAAVLFLTPLLIGAGIGAVLKRRRK